MEPNCNILTPTLIAITAFLSRSPGLLYRGPGGPASLGHGPHFSILSPTDWTSCAPNYIINWRTLFFLWASQFRTQFNPSTVKVISWYSSTGCTCYLHRCISFLDSLAGVNMLQLKTKVIIFLVCFGFVYLCNGIWIFVGYLMLKSSLEKDSKSTWKRYEHPHLLIAKAIRVSIPFPRVLVCKQT